MHGGDRIAEVLQRYGVESLFTLCGGHISPILVGAKRLGIRVVDVRHEVDAVFAADATARLTGVPGVAAVTAGPGVTNTITAVKNAQLAQSPVVILGGATGTILKGRGSLQDIDQLALFEPHVKWAATVARVRDLAPSVEEALYRSLAGVPGPVFVECPVDLLYEESTVRELYGTMGGKPGKGLAGKALGWYLRRHVDGLFKGAGDTTGIDKADPVPLPAIAEPAPRQLRRAASHLKNAKRPVLLVGSQTLLEPSRVGNLVAAVERLGLPTFLSGMARGLLGSGHPLQLRHKRGKALREADLVILAGVPNDFRLGYGRQVRRGAVLISANRSEEDLNKNRRPTQGILADPGRFLSSLAELAGAGSGGEGGSRPEWLRSLRERDQEREREIAEQAALETELVNPLHLCREIESVLPEESVLVADGGDFVGTASYIVSPRGPLSWLDPGVFGTLGVGGGFAIGAKLCRPEAEVWIFYGDGSAAYSLAEFDTYVRHGLPVIAVVGNDASWAQIAREQVEILEDDVGTVLRRTDYHRVAEGYGGKGFLIDRPESIVGVLGQAQAAAAAGSPVLINVLLGKTDFRKGSISM
jgi:acetolactate synthase-1/2/3 large subunit